jgi:hypothetical protein
MNQKWTMPRNFARKAGFYIAKKEKNNVTKR